MTRGRSFIDYVASTFYNEMYEIIGDFIHNNPENLDLYLRKTQTVTNAWLDEIRVRSVSVDDLPDMKIAFDIIVEADLTVEETDYRYNEHENCSQWFKLNCSGDLECGLKDFTIHSIEIYNKKSFHKNPMSDGLVPYIKKEQLEQVAHDFLTRYYPEALVEPVSVNPQELTKRMGLTVIVRPITKDFSVFGQIYFHDCESEFYDEEKDTMVLTKVKGKTIYVDPKAFFLRNLGAVNNTIVHECVHWDKHRKAFELERLYNNSVSRIKCQVAGGIAENTKTTTGWMEWQANSLAPRIQMPISSFKQKALEFVNKYRKELGTFELVDVMQPAIDELAAFFGVSRIAAKLRMLDAGYEDALGAFTFIDGRYVQPHRCKKGAIERNQTFSIGEIDAAILSLTDMNFASVSKNGQYVYVDSHFVLNTPKYVTRTIDGETVLTDYARYHMDECCLVFDISVRTSGGYNQEYHSECVLNRDEKSPFEFDIKFHNGYQNSTPQVQLDYLAQVVEENNQMFNQLSNDYCDCLNKVRKWRNVTFEEIASRILMNERQVRRIFKGESDGSIQTLVAICLALYLPPEISFHIIDKSPLTFSMREDAHKWYKFILTYFTGKSMDEIRQFLISKNISL